MMIFQILFTLVSFALIPFAWIIGTIDKARSIRSTDTPKDIVINLVLFAVLGPVILLVDSFADIYYFWRVMFKTNMN